jgi:hypothetical protein
VALIDRIRAVPAAAVRVTRDRAGVQVDAVGRASGYPVAKAVTHMTTPRDRAADLLSHYFRTAFRAPVSTGTPTTTPR